jgi:quercetin dioxygenase-like cupin family protein
MWWLISLASAAQPAGVVVHLDHVPTHVIADGKGAATLLLGPPDGSSRVALDHLELAAGAQVPSHAHAESDELLYVLSGKVNVSIGAGRWTLLEGNAVLIPAGVEHSAEVAQSARLLQIYAGPGPEERFRAAAPVAEPAVQGDRVVVPSLHPLREALSSWSKNEDNPEGRALLHRGPDGEFDGYRLSGLRAGGWLAQMGLKGGDIVTSIGGVPLTSNRQLLEAWDELGETVDIVLLRRGETVTLRLQAAPQ